jgi:hypothetical protein
MAIHTESVDGLRPSTQRIRLPDIICRCEAMVQGLLGGLGWGPEPTRVTAGVHPKVLGSLVCPGMVDQTYLVSLKPPVSGDGD